MRWKFQLTTTITDITLSGCVCKRPSLKLPFHVNISHYYAYLLDLYISFIILHVVVNIRGDSICNEIALITPLTHGLELYTKYGVK